jgi:hypothetical protein
VSIATAPDLLNGFVAAVRWSEVEPGSHVGSRGGDFMGYVEQTAKGGFVAFDGRSTAVGCYDSLRAAQRAIVGVARGDDSSQPVTRIARVVAPLTGVVAASLLVAAGSLYLGL